jgi:phosphoribosylamine--glycine ligase/phosphoribosylformylglycinamidine cyclo-ligase
MISLAGDIKVLEYNVRFGDPETQTLLSLLDSDLAEIMLVRSFLSLPARARSRRILQACVERRLDCIDLKMKDAAAATVVLASGGYPEKYENGKPIAFKILPSGASFPRDSGPD